MRQGESKRFSSRYGSTLPSRADCWKEIIQLGQHLTGMESSYETFVGIAAVDGPVGQVVAQLLQGDVELWLSEDLWPSYLERCSPIGGVETRSINRTSPSPWMQGAMERRHSFAVRKNERGEYEETTTQAEILAMPLIGNDGTILGVMQVARSQPTSFSPEDHDLLEVLAGQVVMSLQSLQRAAIESWRVDQLSLVRQVSLQILNVRDLDELARRVTGLILDAFHYYFVAIFTKDPGEDLLDFRASAGPGVTAARDSVSHLPNHPAQMGQKSTYSAGMQFRLGEGMIGHVALAGEELVANDVSQEPRYLYLEPLPETRSEATLPLKIQDQVVGVLDVQSNLINDFHEVDLLVLRALADNIAVAVEGARLYSSLERRADHFTAIYEISNAISSILDPEQLLAEVVYLIQKHFGYPYVHLFTVHSGRRKVIFSAGSGARSQPLEEKGFTLDLDDPQGIISWVARSGQTLLVNDVAQEARFRPPPIPPFDTKAELAVPLVYGGEVLGVLDVQSNLVKAFGEDDRFVFEALADNIAVAMRNASLYRSEVWRRQVADSLREVAGLLSADVDLSQVHELILKELIRNLPCDVASIWLLEEGAEEYSREDDESPGDYPALRLASLSGPLASVLNLAQGLSLEGFIHSSLGEQDQAGPESRAALLLEVLQSKEPVIRSAFSLDDPLAVALKFPEDYSSIGAPLRIGDQSLGVLMLSHHTSGRYGQEASGITATFGSYAAVATENTRLYEAAHEQAWVSTVLLQVAEATQAITDPNDLLGAITRITPMLVGVDACAIYTLDEDDVFIPSAVSGLDQERQTAFFQQRFETEQVAAFDELLTERRPSLIRLDVGWTANDSPLKTVFSREEDLGGWRSPKWIIVAPILGREDLLGAFLVVYSPDPAAGGLQQAFEETVSIIQGVSHQLAMAMENSRLQKLQKEEAYVSVALLQVAQAVVSNNDLNDILGSIVRITPILVGIPRVAVFLWDDERQIFLLSQAYGIPKADERAAFTSEKFQALELVRQQDRLLAWPYMASNPGNILESWANLASSPLQDIEQILESGTSLLLSFPLSVKGQVFGVFLLEEPETLFNGNTGPFKRRMRSKRLEIMTGITQQAALAIQNDIVQRDVVRRERLEQEMLMARQIQHTFLPHLVPEFKGWELKVYWQPAREVAGDFYDFFLLPDNRLGVVIADVADKGMPAALFMTLVRTVMRATIQQPESPAEILARVNNILVPDSEQGMFVTLFYLVLSLDTGELAYSNAGHNPPLHFRCPMEEVHHLEKGGIALGVVPDSEFKNSILQLLPGEFLVLYTDGITEAFSPSEEMYGVKGLEDTIRLALIHFPDLSAQELLQGIDQSVQVFVGDSLPADDMTLIVLHRSD
jgi:phosphoserine phosphatase RsbU/P